MTSASDRPRKQPKSQQSGGSARNGSRGNGGSRGNSSNRGEGSRRGRTGDFPKPRLESRPEEKLRGWGSVARKGAASVRDDERRSTDRYSEERSEQTPERQSQVWIQEPAAKAGRSASPEAVKREKFRLPDEAIAELRSHVGAKRVERLAKYLRDAATAYAAERWGDARKSLKVLLAEAPDVPTVKELNAMLLYRTGKYAKAAEALREAHLVTLSFDLYPAMMDCYRALKNYDAIDELWTELRAASPASEVMAEGRIVVAGALADRQRIGEAIALLQKAPKAKRKVGVHHLRTWYVLGDLYDRSGEVGLARGEFKRIVDTDENFADAQQRLDALGD